MSKEPNIFLLVWDQLGLESCTNITDWEKATMWSTLSNTPGPAIGHHLGAILLRARCNTHRHYEIYTIIVDPEINGDSLIKMFSDNPQGSADLIRERGTKIYSDRAKAPLIV